MVKSMADVRREYGALSLELDQIPNDPFILFSEWLEVIIKTDNYDPTAMVLSTVDKKGSPDSRVVLLKGLESKAFNFYTNYSSIKAEQIEANDTVALNFYWPSMARQIRIRGKIFKLSSKINDQYFNSRPRLSQIAAHASPQSQKIESRNVIEKRVNALIDDFGQAPILRPDNWGGYGVTAFEIEFWQGRDNRLHDRFLYTSDENSSWNVCQIAP